jgi:uncharacterized cupin superfamily protein
MSDRHPNIVNITDVPTDEQTNGKFALKHASIGRAVGARQIGCGLIELAPGKTAWPMHWHSANEESIYILSGTGTARIGDATVAVGAGDYIAFPVGPANAHQTTNTGTEPLRYLCFSTANPVEVVGYPDSQKLGAIASERKPDGTVTTVVRALFFDKDQVGYWDGEDGAK